MKISPDDAFQAMLEGRVRRAPARLAALAALATALEPAERPSPDARFRRRLRSEILAAASAAEEDLFAAALEGEHADDRVGQLVTVAAALSQSSAAAVEPDPRFRFALRNRLVAMGSPRGVSLRRPAVARRGARLALAFSAAAMMMSGATLAAAQSALPGDLTYTAKLGQERVALWTVSGTDEGLRKLDFSRRRLSEVRGLAERAERRAPLYTTTLNRMDGLTIDATELILTGFSADREGARDAVERLSSFAATQAADISSLLQRLPPEILPAARDSLGLAESTSARAEAALQGCSDCETDALTPQAESPAGADAAPPAACQTCGSAGETADPETSNGSGGTGADTGTGSGSGDSDTGSGGTGTTPPPPVQDEDAIDLPPVDQTEVDEQVEDVVDDLLDDLEATVPVTAPTTVSPPALSPQAPPLPGL